MYILNTDFATLLHVELRHITLTFSHPKLEDKPNTQILLFGNRNRMEIVLGQKYDKYIWRDFTIRI